MKTLTIKQKMSGTGTIHDLASEHCDREIKFGYGCKYAVVLAAYYGGNHYSLHRTADNAIAAYNRMGDYSMQIIDCDGTHYAVNGDRLVAL